MTEYIIGHKVHGYITTELDNDMILNQASNTVMVVDKSCDENIKDYYNTLRSIIVNRSNIILIGLDDESVTFRVLATLMTSYGEYNIYSVVSKDLITAPYLRELKNRKPDFNEVQTYIGGEVTAMADLSRLMITIEDTVSDGDIDKLSEFVSNNMGSLEELVYTIDYMKSICEQYNSKELINKISKLETIVEKYKASSDKLSIETTQLEEENKINKDKIDSLKKEITKLTEDNERLKEMGDNTSNIITSFKTVNTQVKPCKVKNIIYFKEISYVPYVNTLVVSLMSSIKNKLGKTVKLVIYDNRTEFMKVYNPIFVANGNTYISNKDTLLKKSDRFVVAEPVQNIIEDLLACDNTDVLIIYDRMKTTHDIVEGNNVTKFLVLNSKKEWLSVLGTIKNVDESRIITRADVEFSNLVITIPMLDNYKGGTPAAKESKYVRLPNKKTGENLMQEIFKKARLIAS